jgi:hypothetical protein
MNSKSTIGNLVQFVVEKWGVLDPKSACADFFERVFFGKLLDAANPVRGRFRGLLRTSLGRFIVDNLRRQARDPLAHAGPIDVERRAAELENDIDRGIARTVVERTLAALRLEYGESADQLEYLIGNKSGLALADVAPKLGMTEGSLKVKRHRARSQFKELFLREVEEIAPRGEVREEAKYLFELYLTGGQGLNL